jgi:hypothetical protein
MIFEHTPRQNGVPVVLIEGDVHRRARLLGAEWMGRSVELAGLDLLSVFMGQQVAIHGHRPL